MIVPGQPLHIYQRGNNRMPIFLAEQDFLYFLELLETAAPKAGCLLHAWVLMTNHFHLLVTPQDERAPARMMEALGRRYVRYFNFVNRRTGSLWEGRYRSTLIDSVRYLFICSQYIELNPVRAAMVGDPSAYRWSSFHRNACGASDGLTTSHPLYDALGDTPSARQAAYLRTFARALEPGEIDRIRGAARRRQEDPERQAEPDPA